ncbi:MAG: ubiquinol-cytochrome c reductase iron-sulfur subunit [Alphaproteobacteria bacterium]|nr:ubiquinol-cytochrome c reductase iron-sulfur subunit [Alphaproteobacteria bacterium]
MSAMSDSHDGNMAGGEPTRRDFIHIFSVAMATVGSVGVLVPLVSQMNPDATVLALSTKEVDLSAIPVGQAVKVVWQGKPVFIRHRTKEEIAEAEAVPLSALKDPLARNANLPAKADAEDKNRRIKPEWLLVVGICTHLGCVPLGTAQGENRGDYDGWFCPCHGSQYDVSGRIRKGPAPENLFIPTYKFLTDTSIRIG